MSTARPAVAADTPRLARTIVLAFADDPVMRWLFPDDDWFTDGWVMSEFLCRRWLATDSLWCTDDGVAAAGCIPPGRPEVDLPFPETHHPDWRLARFDAVGAAMGAHTPDEPHWYLNVLATHPDWQRQGLGALVMQPMLERARSAGVPCYLETEKPELVAYYRRHGFEVRTEWDLESDGQGGPHMWGMLRPAEVATG